MSIYAKKNKVEKENQEAKLIKQTFIVTTGALVVIITLTKSIMLHVRALSDMSVIWAMSKLTQMA